MSESLETSVVDALTALIQGVVRDELCAALERATPKWLTTEEAGARIGISASAVRERIRRGGLPAKRWNGRLYIAAASIDRAIEEAEPSATLRTYLRNGPRAAGTAEGLATRR